SDIMPRYTRDPTLPISTALRINKKQSIPAHRGLGEQCCEQVWKLGSAQAQVPAVVAQVLGHEVDLLRALRLEHLRFTHQTLERLGAVLPAHQRDGTECAGVVATLRDLEVANVGSVPEELADARVARERVVDQH